MSCCPRILAADSNSTREDVITLQNPHALPSASTPSTQASQNKAVASKPETKKVAPAGGVAAVKTKEKLPC